MNTGGFIRKLLIRAKAQRHEPRHLSRGRWGEDRATAYLKKKGWKIIARNAKDAQRGELDIVAVADSIFVFVEVKTRKDERFGRPFTAINSQKRRQLCKTAIRFLKKKHIKPDYIRFDVIEVVGTPEGDLPLIRHIENAWPLNNTYHIWW